MENVIQFPLGGIAVRFAVDQLFEHFLGAVELSIGYQRVAQLREGVGQTERIAGPAVAVDQPVMRLDAARQFNDQLIQEPRNSFVLAGVEHGDARTLDDGHGFFALARLQHGLSDLLRQSKIFLVGFKDAQRQRGGLFPILALDVQIKQQLGLFAAFFKVGNIFKKFRCLGNVAMRPNKSEL